MSKLTAPVWLLNDILYVDLINVTNPLSVRFIFLLTKVFSREYSHKDFCLAHLFTDLKFEGGILGLAYVGSPRRNSVGGICTPGS